MTLCSLVASVPVPLAPRHPLHTHVIIADRLLPCLISTGLPSECPAIPAQLWLCLSSQLFCSLEAEPSLSNEVWPLARMSFLGWSPSVFAYFREFPLSSLSLIKDNNSYVKLLLLNVLCGFYLLVTLRLLQAWCRENGKAEGCPPDLGGQVNNSGTWEGKEKEKEL